MNINTDIDDFHMGFLPLRLVGLGDSQNRKMAFRTVYRSAIFPLCGHTECACRYYPEFGITVLSNPSPAPVSPKILREHEHFFHSES